MRAATLLLLAMTMLVTETRASEKDPIPCAETVTSAASTRILSPSGFWEQVRREIEARGVDENTAATHVAAYQAARANVSLLDLGEATTMAVLIIAEQRLLDVDDGQPNRLILTFSKTDGEPFAEVDEPTAGRLLAGFIERLYHLDCLLGGEGFDDPQFRALSDGSLEVILAPRRKLGAKFRVDEMLRLIPVSPFPVQPRAE